MDLIHPYFLDFSQVREAFKNVQSPYLCIGGMLDKEPITMVILE